MAVPALWSSPPLSDASSTRTLLAMVGRSNTFFPYASFVRHLDFRAVASFVADSEMLLASSCKHVTYVNLRTCTMVSTATFVHFFESIPSVRAVYMPCTPNITDLVLFAIARSCTYLRQFDISACHLVTDAGVIALAAACRSLRAIRLAYLRSITEASLHALANYCSELSSMHLAHCSNISDNAALRILTHLPHLNDVRLSHCHELGDAAFPSAPSMKPRLQSPHRPQLQHRLYELRILDLSHCPRVTDDAISRIIDHAPRLCWLMLARCSQLTNKSLESVSVLGSHLHYLHLGSLSALTDQGIRKLASSCPRLQCVNIASAFYVLSSATSP